MAKINISGVARSSFMGIMVMLLIFISGLLMSVSYWVLGKLQTAFESVNCLIVGNLYFESCQEWFMMSIYPALQLKSLLIWFSYFYIFGLIFGLFYIGWKVRKHPALIPVHIVLSIIVGYLSIEIANVYRTLLENEFLYAVFQPFVIYNKIMLYLPTFMFTVIFLSGLLGFFGFWKDKETEGDDELAYQ